VRLDYSRGFAVQQLDAAGDNTLEISIARVENPEVVILIHAVMSG
jgi:hypothetical protein